MCLCWLCYMFDEVGLEVGLCFILRMLQTHLWTCPPARGLQELVSLQVRKTDEQDVEDDMRQERQGKAHPNHFLLLNSPFSALVRFQPCILRARLNMDFSKGPTSALLTKTNGAVRQLDHSLCPFCVKKTRFCRCLSFLSSRWENGIHWSVMEKIHGALKMHTEK